MQFTVTKTVTLSLCKTGKYVVEDRHSSSRDSVVSEDARGWTIQGSKPSRGKILFSPKRPDRLWGPSTLLLKGYRGAFPGDKAAGAEVKEWSYTSTSSLAFMAWTGTALPSPLKVELHSLLTSATDTVSGQLHASAAYPRAKSPRYPLNTRLGVPQSWPGHFGDEKNRLALLGIEPRFLGRPVRSLFTINWLSYPSSKPEAIKAKTELIKHRSLLL
jgi:hypothetical protein